MSPILFFIIFFICTGVGKIFLQINSAVVAFIDILIAAWEGLSEKFTLIPYHKILSFNLRHQYFMKLAPAHYRISHTSKFSEIILQIII